MWAEVVFTRHDATKINDAANFFGNSCSSECLRELAFTLFEVGLFVQGMHQVIGNVNTVQRFGDGNGVVGVAFKDLDLLGPGVLGQAACVAGHHANTVSVAKQLRN